MKQDNKLSEQLQEYADVACELFDIKKVNIHVKDINAGRCVYKTRFISIPKWTYGWRHPKEYPLYYLLHEVAHMIDHDKNGNRSMAGRKPLTHDSIYKTIEKEILALAGISITYKKAYPETLTANGATQKIRTQPAL